MAVMFLSSCNDESDIIGVKPTGDGNSILIDLYSGNQPLSRSVLNTTESAVDHIDVLIFAEDGAKKWHERIACNGTNTTGTISLSAKRSSFTTNTPYWVYLIANSTAEATVFSADDFSLDKLRQMTQEDYRIHVTGLTFEGTETPKNFLMDGVAHLESAGTEPANASAVVLNNGIKADDTKLKVTLRHAAAKIVVNIKKGNAIAFKQSFSNDDGTTTSANPSYYLRNLPYSTSVIASVNGEALLRTNTAKTNTDYFNWGEQQITVTAYAYSHSWKNQSALEKEPRLIVNIPLTYTDKDGNSKDYPDNYYQIPVCGGSELKRNTCYTVTVELNIPGATKDSEPIKLNTITYGVEEWIPKTINIGGESDRPKFLTLNRESMEMHNIVEDNTTLQFASSSEVSAQVTRVYYEDKFGQEQDENTNIVTITPEAGLSGKITVHSPVPTNNTIRYIDVTFTNTDGVTPRTVKIAQYPLEYITNIQGWYSYRSDFGGTTWENYRNLTTKRVSAYNYNKNNDTWSYTATGYGNNYFFTSKVATQITTGTDKGKSKISYYYYKRNNSTSLSTNQIWSAGNARMYHVQITATSDKYTLGRPRIENGITEGGDANALLVSPSFMIASQLGAVFTCNSVEMAASHCKQYVEVDENGNVYDDWRLPTKSEIEIIINFQYKENAAMDEVLTWKSYYSASGTVANPQGTVNNTNAIRCIRDDYDGATRTAVRSKIKKNR